MVATCIATALAGCAARSIHRVFIRDVSGRCERPVIVLEGATGAVAGSLLPVTGGTLHRGRAIT